MYAVGFAASVREVLIFNLSFYSAAATGPCNALSVAAQTLDKS
jgi:hypothetical protein